MWRGLIARLGTWFKALCLWYCRSGFILNLRRVWLLLLLWAILANLAYVTQRDIFYRLAYLILIVLAGAFFWALYSVQTFRLTREVLTPRTQVGRLIEERFTAISTGRIPKLWIELYDAGNLPGHPVGRVLSALSPRVRYTWTVRSLARLRGRFRLGPITIAAGDPFGLFVFQRHLPDTERTLVVYPWTADLTMFAPTLGALRGGERRFRRTHFVTPNAAGTREYAPGDAFNRIHWPSSARHERLIVKEFELDPMADVWILLDMERGIHAGTWGDESWYERALEEWWMQGQAMQLAPNTEEYCVSAAASVAKYYLRHQRAVGLAASNHEYAFAQPDRGERQVARLLEILAVIESDGREPFVSFLARESMRLPRGVTLALVTPSAEREWVRYAQHLKRRGYYLVAIVVDASSFGIRVDFNLVVGELSAGGIPTYLIRLGDDLRATLSREKPFASTS